MGWSMAPTLEPAPTWSGVRVNRYRILELLIVCLYVVCRAESVAGTSGDVLVELPGAAHTEAEALFAQKRAAAIDDAIAGWVFRPGAVPGERVGQERGVGAFEIIDGTGGHSEKSGPRATSNVLSFQQVEALAP